MSLGPGQDGGVTFAGRKNQRLTLQMQTSNVVRFPEDVGLSWRGIDVVFVNAKTGVQFASHKFWYGALGDVDGVAVTVPETGTFRIDVRPQQTFEGDVTVWLKRM